MITKDEAFKEYEVALAEIDKVSREATLKARTRLHEQLKAIRTTLREELRAVRAVSQKTRYIPQKMR